MDRLNLTLDRDTSEALAKQAKRLGRPRAAVARELIKEALERRSAEQRRRSLARDYTAGAADARAVLVDFEAAQLDLLEDEDGQ